MLNRDGQSVSAMDPQLPRCLSQNVRSLSWPQRLPRGFVPMKKKALLHPPTVMIKEKLFASCLFYWKDDALPGCWRCLMIVFKLSSPGLESVPSHRRIREVAWFLILNLAPFRFFSQSLCSMRISWCAKWKLDGVYCISEKKKSNEETWSRASSGHRRHTSNLWLLTFLPFLFQTILGWGSPAAWHTKEATPPWTPVWSSGVRVNLGDAVWGERQKMSHFFCVCVAPLWPRCCSEATATLQISIHTPVYECFNK